MSWAGAVPPVAGERPVAFALAGFSPASAAFPSVGVPVRIPGSRFLGRAVSLPRRCPCLLFSFNPPFLLHTPLLFTLFHSPLSGTVGCSRHLPPPSPFTALLPLLPSGPPRHHHIPEALPGCIELAFPPRIAPLRRHPPARTPADMPGPPSLGRGGHERERQGLGTPPIRGGYPL